MYYLMGALDAAAAALNNVLRETDCGPVSREKVSAALQVIDAERAKLALAIHDGKGY